MIHPWPRAHRRREPGLEAKLNTLRAGEPADVSELFLDEHDDFAVPLAPLQQFLNARAEDAQDRLRAAPAIRTIGFDGSDVFTTERKWNGLRDALLTALQEFHAASPLAPGRDMEELRDRLPARIPPRLFRAFVERLETEKIVAREGSLLRLPGHTVTLGADAQRTADRIAALLAATPLSPPALPQIERDTGIGRATLTQVMRVLERARSVVRVSDDLYFLRDSIEGVARTLRDELSESDEITPAMFRDRFETTRKYAIPLLEYLDREGVTIRKGDVRRLKAPRATIRS